MTGTPTPAPDRRGESDGPGWPGLRRGAVAPPDAASFVAARTRAASLADRRFVDGGLAGSGAAQSRVAENQGAQNRVAQNQGAQNQGAQNRVAQSRVAESPLGRLGELAAWVAACQHRCTPWLVSRVRAIVLAGDHGVSTFGVTEERPGTGGQRFAELTSGTAPVAVLAREHNVRLRAYDVGLAADPPAELAPLARYKMTRSTRPIHLADATSPARAELDLLLGEFVASAEIAAGADLLIVGGLGPGQAVPAAALVAATLGLRGEQVVGGGTGRTRDRAVARVNQALDRVGPIPDPGVRLAALGSPGLALGAGALVTAARRGVPVLLDGLVSTAMALLADELAPGVAAWCRAAHRSPDPGQQAALAALGLEPILDLGIALEDGSGALIALPVLRSAVRLLRDLPMVDS